MPNLLTFREKPGQRDQGQEAKLRISFQSIQSLKKHRDFTSGNKIIMESDHFRRIFIKSQILKQVKRYNGLASADALFFTDTKLLTQKDWFT